MKLLVEHFESKISELSSSKEHDGLNMSVRSGITKASASQKGGKVSAKAKTSKENESE